MCVTARTPHKMPHAKCHRIAAQQPIKLAALVTLYKSMTDANSARPGIAPLLKQYFISKHALLMDQTAVEY